MGFWILYLGEPYARQVPYPVYYLSDPPKLIDFKYEEKNNTNKKSQCPYCPEHFLKIIFLS